MAFKMKGNPFTSGTIKGTGSYKNAVKKLKLERTGYKNLIDGRAKSSAFQLTEEDKIKWGPKTSETTTQISKTDPSISTITTTSVEEGLRQRGKRKPTGLTACSKEQIALDGGAACRKYKKTLEPKTRETIKKSCKCTKADGTELPYEVPEGQDCEQAKPAACTETPPEKEVRKPETREYCSCKTVGSIPYGTGVGHTRLSYAKYYCEDGLPPECQPGKGPRGTKLIEEAYNVADSTDPNRNVALVNPKSGYTRPNQHLTMPFYTSKGRMRLPDNTTIGPGDEGYISYDDFYGEKGFQKGR